MRVVLAVAGLCCMYTAAHAATFCVHTSTQLQNALATAENNAQDDVIKVTEGYYLAPAGGFDYQTYASQDDDDHDLEISGGWFDALNLACLGHHNTPFQTVLDGSGSDRVMYLIMRTHSSITVRFLTFSNGDAGNGSGGGLSLFAGDIGFAATWTVERNAFVGNSAKFGGGLHATINQASSTARVRVINNLFLLNHASTDIAAAELVVDGGDSINVTNNTILSNTSDNATSNAIGGIYVAGSDVFQFIANNNFWSNDRYDVYVLADPAGYSLLHNNYQLRGGSPPSALQGNISVEPEYQHGTFNYTPVRNSPLVDAGINPPPISINWYLTNTDLAGAERKIGDVDIGAYEEDIIFSDSFEMPIF
ncbi:MAG: choice-of-anchor Q domain-containing protein [Rhodanobacteraceae bacterium]